MASPSERSSSSRSTTTLMPGRLVIACDATKNINAQEFRHIITNIQMRDGMIQEVDTITVLGVLHKVLHPSKFMYFQCASQCPLDFGHSLFELGIKILFRVCNWVINNQL